MIKESKRQELAILQSALERERSSFESHWKELSEYILPRKARFTLSENNRGEKKNQKIINSTQVLASRTLSAGLMGGVTSPAREWFRLSMADIESVESGAVKEWLKVVTDRMNTVFTRSNLYNELPSVYADMGTFGTSAILAEEDFDDVVHFHTFPIGSYMIGTDDKMQVSVFFREFRYTVRQIIKKFGSKGADGELNTSNFSNRVKTAIQKKQYDEWIDICHVIKENEDYDPEKLGSKRFESIYYEKGVVSDSKNYGKEPEVYLRESGYDRFPVMCPRWDTTGEDVYGTNSCGMTALGDIKALQIMEKRYAQAVEKMVNPPMTAPTALRNSKSSIVAGDITFSDDREGQKGFRPVHEVNPRVLELAQKIEKHEFLIKRAYYEDLFLMLASSDRRQITAREVEERHEEKLLALGSVLEQLNQDLLDPLIDIVFYFMELQGLIPEPPEEIAGSSLEIEYISIMHQAQKLTGLAGIERLTEYVGNVAQFKPEALDKLDVDALIDAYANIMGTPPKVVLTEEQVAEIRDARAEEIAKAEAMEQAQAGAGVAKDLSQSSVEGGNALSSLLEQNQAGQVPV